MPIVLGVTPPPPQFDIPPSVPVIEQVLSAAEVHRICAGVVKQIIPPNMHYQGCAVFQYINGQKTCLIWRIDDARVKRHEMGHCSFWPADHPMEVVSKPAIEASKKWTELLLKNMTSEKAHDWSTTNGNLPWPSK